MPLVGWMWFAGCFLFCQFLLRFIVKYKIGDKDVRVILFGIIPFFPRIMYSEIYSVETIPWWRCFPYPHIVNMPLNRLIARRFVIIKLRYRFIWRPTYLLSPDNPDEFVQVVKGIIAKEESEKISAEIGKMTHTDTA